MLAVLVWQAGAMLLHNPLLLASPVQVLRRLGELLFEKGFWKTLGFSFGNITLGFCLALLLSALLAALSYRFPLVQTLLRPYIAAVRAVPVASFIVLALLWLSSRRISLFISFLMVFPVLYTNLLQGIRAADPELLEAAQIFRMSLWRKQRYIYLPALHPYFRAACRTGIGLCWKAGVAAEVISVAASSVGGRLYDAKVYLETADLFAWTVVIVAVSVLFEKLFLRVLEAVLFRLEGKA